MTDSDNASVMDFEYDSDDSDVTSSAEMAAKKPRRSDYGNSNILKSYLGYAKEQQKTYSNTKYRNDYAVQQVEFSCAENWDEEETTSNQNTNPKEKHALSNLDDKRKERKECVETSSNQKTKTEENHALPNWDVKRKGKGHGDKDEERRKKKDKSTKTNKRVAEMVPEKSKDGWVLFVKSLHEEVTENEVKDLFADYGEICNIQMNLCRRTGFAEGYALIKYTTYDDALKAKESLDNTEFLGVNISVDWCFLKKEKK